MSLSARKARHKAQRARRSLERSFNADAYNRVTYNLLMMLDKLDKFTVVA